MAKNKIRHRIIISKNPDGTYAITQTTIDNGRTISVNVIRGLTKDEATYKKEQLIKQDKLTNGL